jgi:low temperature requirement protein LtrA
METGAVERSPRLAAVMREGERVKPLELFFDLVFVLAVTQCTALMVAHPTWEGLAQGVLVLALLWWSWTGYAWLTSVLDPEEGAVRIALFASMAALLIAALTVPDAFGDLGLEFALAYGVVRVAHIALFVLASRDDPALRHSVGGLAAGTAVGVGLLIAGSFFDGAGQGVLWGLALLLDMAEPYFFGAEGWKLVPGHFAERHGLIIIVALGESVVALGVGSSAGLTAGVAAAAVLGIALVAELWWAYFDIVAIANVRRLVRTPEGRERNELARDAYSYLHFPLVAGIVLGALGLHEALAHPEDPLETVPAFALLGGVAIYLLGHVVVRLRGAHTLNRQRLGLALVLFALIPAAGELSALAILGIVTALLAVMIVYETRIYGEGRTRVRREFDAGELGGERA